MRLKTPGRVRDNVSKRRGARLPSVGVYKGPLALVRVQGEGATLHKLNAGRVDRAAEPCKDGALNEPLSGPRALGARLKPVDGVNVDAGGHVAKYNPPVLMV